MIIIAILIMLFAKFSMNSLQVPPPVLIHSLCKTNCRFIHAYTPLFFVFNDILSRVENILKVYKPHIFFFFFIHANEYIIFRIVMCIYFSLLLIVLREISKIIRSTNTIWSTATKASEAMTRAARVTPSAHRSQRVITTR